MFKIIVLYFVILAGLLLFAYVADKLHIGGGSDGGSNGFTEEQLRAFENTEYVQYARALFDCIKANHLKIGLVAPTFLQQNMEVDGMRVKYDAKTNSIYCAYIFDRAISVGNGAVLEQVKNGLYSYSTFPVDRMQAILNRNFSNYCLSYAIPPCPVVHITDEVDGRVKIYIQRKVGI